jgi:hypothetical protein
MAIAVAIPQKCFIGKTTNEARRERAKPITLNERDIGKGIASELERKRII